MKDGASRQVIDAARQRDVAVGLVCALVAFAASLYASSWIGPFVAFKEFDNVYFQADCSLVYSNMTERSSNHYRTGMHPLFSMVLWSGVGLLRAVGLEALTAVRSVLGLNAGVTSALLYLILRKCGLRPFDAALFALSFAASVALLFFGSVPETFAFGGTTLLVVLVVAAILPRPSERLLLVANVASMSMTLTNWMAGIAATVRSYPRDRKVMLRVFGWAGLIVGVGGVLSKLLFSSSGYAGDFRRYVQWVRLPQVSDLRSFFAHSTVMPEPVFRLAGNGVMESVAEPAGIGAGSTLGLICALGWFALLAMGLYGAVTRSKHQPLRDVLGATLLGQFALHMCFADGPFLFSAHFGPLLLLAAAHSRLLPLPKWPARLATLALLGGIAWNNLDAHRTTTARFEREVLPWLKVHGTPRAVVSSNE
jgi:hypothetical protein